LFHKGLLPAVDVGKSVSRVGGKAQLPAYRLVAGALKLYYAQFEELEMFARFGTRLDERTRATLERGKRVREILKQHEQDPLSPCEQIVVLLSVTEGLLDQLPLDQIAQAERIIRGLATTQLVELGQRIQQGETLTDDDKASILKTVRQALDNGVNGGNRTNP